MASTNSIKMTVRSHHSKATATNTQGFGVGYLANVNRQMKVSQALRTDPKVQRRYVQAQLNEIGEKTVELI